MTGSLASRAAVGERLARRAGCVLSGCLVLGACLALSACASAEGSGSPDATATLTVLAAASLTDVLEDVATDLEAEHDGLDVRLTFAASSTVVQQVNEGAPADVVALAGEEPLRQLDPVLLVGEPVVFATNTLELVVPSDNPAGITGVEDLERDGIRLVVCAEQVPCGAAAAALLVRLGVEAPVASYERDVRATLAKVELGEADAGLVYRTDVAAAQDRVRGIPVPGAEAVPTRYPVVAVSDAPLAAALIDELVSPRGRAHLADAGFGAP